MRSRSPHDVARSARRGVWAAGVVTVGLLVAAAAVVFAEVRQPPVWDPLGDYPIQTVVDGDHSLRVDGLVTVEAVKCADEHVTVRGTLSWQAMDPPGSVIDVGDGVAERSKGCKSFVFQNPIPSEVRDVIRAQHADGIDEPVWRLTGIEIPGDGAREGVPRTWVSENLSVTP